MANTKKNTQNEDYDTILSASCLQDYLKIIKKTKPATRKENDEMFSKYQNGDLAIKDLIIKKNLSLVVSIVFEIGGNLSDEQKLEYIESGTIGLIEAVDAFDPSRGTAFSTYATYYIEMRINSYRYHNKRLIRRPAYMEVALAKYNRLISEYEKAGKPLPSRDEICTILEISKEVLKRIEEDYKLEASSLDAAVKNDDEKSDDLSEFVGVEESGFNSLLDEIILEEIIKTLKYNTNEYEYFILYYRMISSEQKSCAEIGNYFGLSRVAIYNVEMKLKSKIKEMFDENHVLKREFIDEVKMKFPFESIKVTPTLLENYTLYFYLRENFFAKDQIILKEKLISNLTFDIRRVASEIMESEEYVREKSIDIDRLIRKTTNDIRYQLFSNNLIKSLKNKIYFLDLDSDLSDYFDIRKIINDYWQDKSLNEVLEASSLYNIQSDENLMNLINKFYGFVPKKDISFNKERLERDVNYSLYGFAKKDLPIEKFYSAFLENQNKFTSRERDFLNAYIFKKEEVSEDPSNSCMIYDSSVIDKLVLLYYKTENYKNDNFSLEKYKFVRDECMNNIGERGIMLLDLYYGLNGDSMLIREMAEFLKEYEDEVEKDFRRAKNNAISIYLGTSQYSFEKDKDIYASILNDENFVLGSPHLEIAKMFFLDGKTYDEIANLYEITPKLTQRRVSELNKYACTVMDYYRFGITSTKKNYPKEFLISILNKTEYDEEMKDILTTYIDNKSSVITAEIYQKDLEEVRNIIRRFNNLVNKIAISEVDVTKEDVEAAVLEHDSTNILSERERIILSLNYGLKNIYNPSGKKKYPIDIAEQLEINSNIGSVIKKAKEHVSAHKLGLLKTAIDFIDRNKLETVLRDQRLPLNEEDKNIIINAYGLYDTEYLSIKEISLKYNLREPIARKRLYRGIITINKYLNQEIDKAVLFEVDIEPYLKYFIIEDREILTLLYKDKLTQLEIQQKYNLSHHQFDLLMQKMLMHLSDLKSGLATGIDFDYFWDNALEEDIPFYGNKELAVELCFLHYEKRLTRSDIVKYHHPELSDNAVGELIRSFTVAIIKHQHGIRKANDFSYEEVADYYNRHKDSLGAVNTKIYGLYFKKVQKNGPFAKIRPRKLITYDLIKEKFPDHFRLDNTNPDQVREILGDYGDTLSEESRETLESLFGVTHANLLSDEEWEQIINFLGFLQIRIEKDNQKIKKDVLEESNKTKKRKELKQ
ncbi:MAG: hypothetical protein J1F35_00225 [Erysipelotrichales bacterium]|nr:hypothetical protein [Erysipelotrichales bacterium]